MCEPMLNAIPHAEKALSWKEAEAERGVGRTTHRAALLEEMSILVVISIGRRRLVWGKFYRRRRGWRRKTLAALHDGSSQVMRRTSSGPLCSWVQTYQAKAMEEEALFPVQPARCMRGSRLRNR